MGSLARIDSHRDNDLPSVARMAPDLVAYTAGNDYAELLCGGKAIAVIPVETVPIVAAE